MNLLDAITGGGIPESDRHERVAKAFAYPDTLDYPGHGQVSFEWKEARVKVVK